MWRLAMLVLVACGRLDFAPHEPPATFGPGALIIPTSSAFQDACGAVSAFGLVVEATRANPWLAAHGLRTVRVFRAIDPAKASPNRCPPTDRSTPPAPSDDPRWSDGCDLRATNAGGAPVTLISAGRDDGTVVTLDTTARADVFPTYPAVTIDDNVTAVGYPGGPFVIPVEDAASLLGLLDGSLTATDADGNAIDFTPFRDPTACTLGTTHGVRVHRVAAGTSLSLPPLARVAVPHLAVLDSDSSKATKNVAANIMPKHLAAAGLLEPAGCPDGGQNAANEALCPRGGRPGAVYDVFDFADLAADRAHAPSYGALWLPHWDSSAMGSNAPNAMEQAAAANIAGFVDTPRRLLAACVSAESLEGGVMGTMPDRIGAGPLVTCAGPGCTAPQRGLIKNSAPMNVTLPNCTDPTTATGASCAYYAAPGDPLAQTADYMWIKSGGSMNDFLPNAGDGVTYRPSVQPLISDVRSFDPALLATPRAMVTADLATRSYADDDPARGELVYLAGHDHTAEVAGSVFVLGTLVAP